MASASRRAQVDARHGLEGAQGHDVDGQAGGDDLAGQTRDGDVVLGQAQGPRHLAPVEVLPHENRGILDAGCRCAVAVVLAGQHLDTARLPAPR